jgi:sugar transferase (PEP-CTERM/EpsH1 system associated)
MRVLVLTSKFVWPLTDGAIIRNFNLLRETARHHDVVLLSFLFDPNDRERFDDIKPYCEKIVGVDLERPKSGTIMNAIAGSVGSRPFILREYLRREMASALEKTVVEEKIDVIHAHFLHMGQYLIDRKSAAVVYDAHNLEHVLWERLSKNWTNPLKKTFANLQYERLIKWQQKMADCSEVCVTLSDEDREEYLRISPDADVITVPNGADIEFWNPSPDEVEPDSIIYFGNLSWYPQADAAIHFHDDILPRVRAEIPGVKFYIVGQNPPESVKRLAGEKVIVTGFVDDIREYIARAAVVVMPLRVGAGTKHRIFHALGMEKAMVASSVAAEGIALTHGETAMLADDPEPFANHVITLLKNPDLRVQLGKSGRELVCDRYDWSKIYDNLETAFQRAHDKNTG